MKLIEVDYYENEALPGEPEYAYCTCPKGFLLMIKSNYKDPEHNQYLPMTQLKEGDDAKLRGLVIVSDKLEDIEKTADVLIGKIKNPSICENAKVCKLIEGSPKCPHSVIHDYFSCCPTPCKRITDGGNVGSVCIKI